MAPSFSFDGREVPCQPGDTLGSALHRAGVKVLSRSLKYHRPRGLYCCTGSCASCFVEVDGVPNVQACMTAAKPRAEVRSQNRVGSARRDLLGVVDKAFPRGFDPHGAFTRPRLLNAAFLKTVRFMSGLGRPPRADVRVEGPRRHTLAVDELIVGAGLQGLRRAHAAAGKGRRILLVDEMPALGGSARWDPSDTESLRLAAGVMRLAGVEAWTDAVVFGLYGDVAAVRRGDDLWEVRAGRITVAPGRYDAWPLFAGNDLPGVLSLRGARRLLGEHGVLPGRLVVGHGEPLPESFVADLNAQGGRVVHEGEVEEVRGGTCVEKARVGGEWIACDAVVCNTPGTPRVELLQQAGCELLTDAGGRLVARLDASGATSRSRVFAAYSEAP